MPTVTTLTYGDIAYEVLKSSKARSLHYKDITQLAFERELVESDDSITAGNISAAINAEVKRCAVRGEECRFVKHDRAYYGLLENEPKGIFAEIRAKNNAVKDRLLSTLLAMDPTRFEELVGEVLRKLNFENVAVTRQSGDGGIDVLGEMVVGGVLRSNVRVQVKRWRANTQPGDIQQLRGSLSPHETGLFITTADFSPASRIEAAHANKAPIALMNGRELVEFMCEFGIGVSSERVVILALEENTEGLQFSTPPEPDPETGLEIFAKYKGHDHYAVYFSPTKVLLDNVYHKSPSKAAVAVSGSQVNGWSFWKYKDERTGKVYPLDEIRKASK